VLNSTGFAEARRGLGSIVALLEHLGESAAFAYGSILLLELRRVWDMWTVRDLTDGDTVRHFAQAVSWSPGLPLDPVRGPLYVQILYLLARLSGDAYATLISLRLLATFVLAATVLAVFRRLLSPLWAWLCAAWWVLLPVHFDTLYELHLFAAATAVPAAVFAARGSPAGRGIALGLLAGTALLVRAEYALAAMGFGVACLAHEASGTRRRGTGPWVSRLIRPYGLPLLTVGVLLLPIYVPIRVDPGVAFNRMTGKHSLNFCQAFALNYKQRRADFPRDPWLACGTLMERVFGERRPTLARALASNPAAVLEHFLWNVRLAPSGLQLLIFGRTSDSLSPDFVAMPTRSPAATAGTTFLLGLLAAAFLRARRRRDAARPSAVPGAQWGWCALLCLGVTAVFVMVTVRPRPGYILPLTVLALAVIGRATQSLFEVPAASRAGRAVVPIAATLLLVVVPSHFGADYRNPWGQRGRPLLEAVRRIAPAGRSWRGPIVLAAPYKPWQLCVYATWQPRCQGVHLDQIRSRRSHDLPPLERIERIGVTHIYADEVALESRELGETLRRLQGDGWQRIAPPQDSPQRWILLERPP
jgi:hypothetical protein